MIHAGTARILPNLIRTWFGSAGAGRGAGMLQAAGVICLTHINECRRAEDPPVSLHSDASGAGRLTRGFFDG